MRTHSSPDDAYCQSIGRDRKVADLVQAGRPNESVYCAGNLGRTGHKGQMAFVLEPNDLRLRYSVGQFTQVPR